MSEQNNEYQANQEDFEGEQGKQDPISRLKYNKRNRKKPLNTYLPLLLALILIIGMQLGFIMYEKLKGTGSHHSHKSALSQIPELDEVLHYIDENYVDKVDNDELIQKAIENTLKELDPHSSYIAAKDLKDINESLRGNFEGIGVEFSIVKDTIMVVSPIVGGPSHKLGIQTGDKIIEIEDTLVAGIGIKSNEVIKKLKGKKNTVANIKIYRKGVPELLSYAIKRDKIPLVSVDVGYMLDENVGYIKITRFSATTYEEFREVLEDLKEMGMKRLMLDLRENPGGYLAAAVEIADEFIGGHNLLVYTEGKNYKKREYTARRRGLFEEGDLTILINEGSASASEIVSGAIQDWDRGTIVGRRSFGKGLVQEQYDLTNGSALRLTIARYYTPVGRCIQKPYDEGLEAYRDEIDDRFDSTEKGDSTQVADSLTYQTFIEKRTVYGGGGVMPDIRVSPDTTGTESYLIRARSLIPQFVYDHFSNNKTYFKSFKTFENFRNNFTISPDLFRRFKTFLKDEIGLIDEKLLARDREELDIYLRAYLARQLWNNDGFYPIIHETDKTLQKAYADIRKGLATRK